MNPTLTRDAWWLVGLILVALISQENPQLAGFIIVAVVVFLGIAAARKGLV